MTTGFDEPTTEVHDVDYPDGANEQGISNATALDIEHHRALFGDDYIRYTSYSGPNGTVEETAYADWDNKKILVQRNTSNDGGTVHSTIFQAYLNSDQYTIHRAPNGTVSYEERDRYFLNFYKDYAVAGNNYVPGYVEAKNRFFQSTLQGTTAPVGNTTQINYTASNATTHNVTGTLTLTEDGMRSRLRLRFRDTEGWHTYTVQYQRTPTSVDWPAWYEDAEDWDDETFTELEQELATRAGIDNVASESGGGCGTNDGDQDYVEDNDRDNDGLCDED